MESHSHEGLIKQLLAAGPVLPLYVVCLISVFYDWNELNSAYNEVDGCIRQSYVLVGYTAQMGKSASCSCAAQNQTAHVCMYEREICGFTCAGMSDDWVIYRSELHAKWSFKPKEL